MGLFRDSYALASTTYESAMEAPSSFCDWAEVRICKASDERHVLIRTSAYAIPTFGFPLENIAAFSKYPKDFWISQARTWAFATAKFASKESGADFKNANPRETVSEGTWPGVFNHSSSAANSGRSVGETSMTVPSGILLFDVKSETEYFPGHLVANWSSQPAIAEAETQEAKIEFEAAEGLAIQTNTPLASKSVPQS